MKDCENCSIKEDLEELKQTYEACYKEHIRIVEQNKALQFRIKELEAIASLELNLANNLKAILDLNNS